MFTDYDIATAIGGRLLTKVAADMRQWLESGLDPGRVAVNLSSAEFSNPGIAGEVLGVLDQWAIPTGNFEVEVTESVLLGRSANDVASILKQFHRQGVMVALDDFGTGYASLTHLKQFPVDHVKIDQSFVKDMEQGVGDEAIVAAVIGLARGLNLQVTAEGVETFGQAARLRDLGCHNAQGYLIAKPMPGAEVAAFISDFQTSRYAG
jgi:EAL domain-containing protein (putative c-di-GMP-specific phosphodiesterase class I)